MPAINLKTTLIILAMGFLFFSCQQNPAGTAPDITAPGPVTAVTKDLTATEVTLRWTDPQESDFEEVVISVTGAETGSHIIGKGVGTLSLAGLITGSEYKISMSALDSNGNSSDPVEISFIPASKGQSYSFEVSTGTMMTRKLFYVPQGDYYVGSTFNSTFDYSGNSNVHLSNGFFIAEYETTYQLWYDVKTWATAHGYAFHYQGMEGNDGVEGAAPTAAKNEPVSYLSWRDAIVWLNALSEIEGLTPVYRLNGEILKSSTDVASEIFHGVSLDFNANGYRLPTEAEWEIAARGADPSNAVSYSTTYAGGNDRDTYGMSYVYTNHTWNVGSCQPNEIGTYDMSGNVMEWCFDLMGTYPAALNDPSGNPAGTKRARRGGSFSNNDITIVTRLTGYSEWQRNNNMGFRIARSN